MTARDAASATVRVTVPADAAYQGLLRVAAATAATRARLGLEAADDARLAVGEAAAVLLLATADPPAVAATFEVRDQQVGATLTATGSGPALLEPPATARYARALLGALAQHVAYEAVGRTATLRFRLGPGSEPDDDLAAGAAGAAR